MARILAEKAESSLSPSHSFSRCTTFWRGTAPRAIVEIAEHPFILEFPRKASDLDEITNYRRIREHHRLTQLLNVLLRGGTSFQLPRS